MDLLNKYSVDLIHDFYYREMLNTEQRRNRDTAVRLVLTLGSGSSLVAHTTHHFIIQNTLPNSRNKWLINC